MPIARAKGCCTKPLSRQCCDMIVFDAAPAPEVMSYDRDLQAPSAWPLYLGVYHSNDTSANPRPNEPATLYAAVAYAQ